MQETEKRREERGERIQRRREEGRCTEPPSDIIKQTQTAAGISNAPQCTLGRIKSSAGAKGEQVNFAEDGGVEREKAREGGREGGGCV